jgi:NADPH2:quinone reductase
VQQLIYKNQSLIGFNVPSLPPERIAECVPPLLRLISEGKVNLFATNLFPLAEVKRAFEALESRRRIGKVVLAA